MAGYDDDRIASDKEAEAMNDEYAAINAAKGRRRAEGILPVYLTDEAHRAAECCFAAAEGCVYLLDYATTPDEKRLLRYAADEMKGLSSALGGGRKISSSYLFVFTFCMLIRTNLLLYSTTWQFFHKVTNCSSICDTNRRNVPPVRPSAPRPPSHIAKPRPSP